LALSRTSRLLRSNGNRLGNWVVVTFFAGRWTACASVGSRAVLQGEMLPDTTKWPANMFSPRRPDRTLHRLRAQTHGSCPLTRDARVPRADIVENAHGGLHKSCSALVLTVAQVPESE
jgi:hypothetical protein